MGLHGLLAYRSSFLQGILNGIDILEWDPARDPHLVQPYDSKRLEGKLANKRALQERLGLPQDDAPLFGVVARLTEQKGVDLIAAIAPALVELPGRLAVLGRGEPRYEEALGELARAYPDSISVTIAFDESLAHQIEAGADLFLMPSRFEPCGMNQMYSQRYGTVPIVHATGGLADSVTDYGQPGGTGFVFAEETAEGLMDAVRRAIDVFRNPPAWRKLQEAGMARDFSWDNSARQYLEIYRRLSAQATRKKPKSVTFKNGERTTTRLSG
jgi:starch synthase